MTQQCGIQKYNCHSPRNLHVICNKQVKAFEVPQSHINFKPENAVHQRSEWPSDSTPVPDHDPSAATTSGSSYATTKSFSLHLTKRAMEPNVLRFNSQPTKIVVWSWLECVNYNVSTLCGTQHDNTGRQHASVSFHPFNLSNNSCTNCNVQNRI